MTTPRSALLLLLATHPFWACGSSSVRDDSSCAADAECRSAEPAEIDCPDYWTTPADPDGDGVLECVHVDSTCFSPADCPSDPCCPRSCVEDDFWAGGFACTPACPAVEPCATDAECEARMGAPGWTCEAGCPDRCVPPVPPPECTTTADCVLARPCGRPCTVPVPRSALLENPCLVAEDEEPGEVPVDPDTCDCEPGPCEDWAGVDCFDGQCIAGME